MFFIYFKDTNFDFDRCKLYHIKDTVHVDAYYIPNIEKCPDCESTSLSKNGHITKTVKHCTYSTSLIVVKCHIQRYKCKNCNHIFYEDDTFSFPGDSVSKESLLIIEDRLKFYNQTFESVAKEMHISRKLVIDLFDKYFDYPTPSILPDILSFDEKSINKNMTDNAYMFVLADFRKVELVDLVHSRHKYVLEKYFSKFSLDVRKNVKYITMDMWEPYLDVAKRYFKNAIIAIDSFHVIKTINNALDRIRISVMRKYNLETQNIEDNDNYYYILKKYKHILLKDFDEIGNFRIYNKKLKMYIDKYNIRDYMLYISDDLRKAYSLVTKYREFNKTCTFENAATELDEIINDFYNSKLNPMIEVAKTLSTWKEYIINSFIVIPDSLDSNNKPRRLSNGPIECLNNIIKKIYTNGNGFSNFWRFRKRCIYCINKDLTFILKN